MGLDMHLYVTKDVAADDPLRDKILGVLSEENRKRLVDPDWERTTYSNGYDRFKDPDYDDLVELAGIVPTADSPMILVKQNAGGLRIYATLVYWRKVNSVHAWFVHSVQAGVDECQESLVGPEALAGLVDLCERVTVDHSLAPTLLPNYHGPFFGGYDYDESYFMDIEETARTLKARMSEVAGKGWSFRYRSSW